MLDDLGNVNIVLSNELYIEKGKEKNKSDLNKENDFYSLINKKRKRHFSNNKNYKVYKCPSCASSFLSKYYKHIHEKNNFKTNNNNKKNLEIKTNQQNQDSQSKIKIQNISNCFKNYNKINMKEANYSSDDKTKGNNENNIIKVKKINFENNDNNGEVNSNNKYTEKEDYYQNVIIPENEKKSNEKKNIFVCKLIRSELKKEIPTTEKQKKEKKIIIKVEKCIAPQI